MSDGNVIIMNVVVPETGAISIKKEKEGILTPEGLDAVISCHENTSGIRDLEQAAEHIAANALYQIEVNHVSSVTFDAEMVRELLLSC